MKCPECNEAMQDMGYTHMMFFKCECGRKVKMSIDEWLASDDGKQYRQEQERIKRQVAYWEYQERLKSLPMGKLEIDNDTAQNAEIPPKSDNVTHKS